MTGYTVIDFETTGFNPARNDRVVELGIVFVSEDGLAEGEWTTLVNPSRDVGPKHIHGIESRDLIAAPAFGDVADRLIEAVAGRTIVAHNASFDMRFLHAEMDRAGYLLPEQPAALCSMKWSGRLIGPAKLQHCCEAIGVPLTDAHHALGDARATAGLLAFLIQNGHQHPEWDVDVHRSRTFKWPKATTHRRTVALAYRSHTPPQPDSWMAAVMEATWVAGSPENEASYMLALDSALLDRYVSASEGAELILLAQQSGLSREVIMELHRGYLDEMAKVALADGVLSDEERADMEMAAAALGLNIEQVDQSLAVAAQSPAADAWVETFLKIGDRVVFTGEMRRDRDEWIALAVGAELASGGVTKATRVLVAADPDSLSGKAAKARRYGVPVVSEDAFERLFADYCTGRLDI